MFLIKQICLIVFIIITILFTVGYATQPILSNYSKTITPTDSNKPEQTVNTNFYITHFDNLVSDFKGTYTQNNDYSSIDNNKRLVFTTLFYMCVLITFTMAVSIILGFVGFKFVSKIIFFLILILMIIVFILMQFVIIAGSLINMVQTQKFTTPETANGNGYYLILVSTILMVVNYIVYAILG
jgi:hypothetical protein